MVIWDIVIVSSPFNMALAPSPPNGQASDQTSPDKGDFVSIQLKSPETADENDQFVDDASACINDQNQVYYTTTVSNNGTQDQKPSLQGDVISGVNNLRLNVNNNRLIGKMRKISITELNRRRRSSKHARLYKLAFYVAISSLSFLFLYLIYQNLFNDG